MPERYGSTAQLKGTYGNYKQTLNVFARIPAALDGQPGAERLVEWLDLSGKPDALTIGVFDGSADGNDTQQPPSTAVL